MTTSPSSREPESPQVINLPAPSATWPLRLCLLETQRPLWLLEQEDKTAPLKINAKLKIETFHFPAVNCSVPLTIPAR